MESKKVQTLTSARSCIIDILKNQSSLISSSPIMSCNDTLKRINWSDSCGVGSLAFVLRTSAEIKLLIKLCYWSKVNHILNLRFKPKKTKKYTFLYRKRKKNLIYDCKTLQFLQTVGLFILNAKHQYRKFSTYRITFNFTKTKFENVLFLNSGMTGSWFRINESFFNH